MLILKTVIGKCTGSGCRLALSRFFTVLLPLFMCAVAHSQNLFDYDHSKAYGQYLFDTRQYKLSAEEWERVLFMQPDNETACTLLARSYLLDKEYNLARVKIKALFPDPVKMTESFADIYAKSLILLDSLSEAESFIRQNQSLRSDHILFLNLNIELGRNWVKAGDFYRLHQDSIIAFEPRYSGVAEMISRNSTKNPWLAGGMSTIIPGTGKIYAGEWKDGLISLFFVGATVFQSIRGYNQYGPKSGFFITYTSVATAFYLGNIYGSFKSVIRHNKRNESHTKNYIHSIFLL